MWFQVSRIAVFAAISGLLTGFEAHSPNQKRKAGKKIVMEFFLQLAAVPRRS